MRKVRPKTRRIISILLTFAMLLAFMPTFPQAASAASETDVTFTAEQIGGTSGTVASTGIVLTFSIDVIGLTVDDITIINGTGNVTKGTLSGADATWTIGLTGVTAEGNVSVSVAKFGDFNVITTSQTVAVYMNSALPTPEAPAVPTLSNKSAASVNLDSISGAEYAVNTINSATGLVWQGSETFTGLTPNTTYYFFARIKAVSDANYASAASPSLAVTTDMAALGGTVEIRGTAQYGQTLTAVTTGLTSTPASVLGVLYYQWKRNGAAISGAEDSTYVLGEDDISQTITVTVETANCTGVVTSALAAIITKAAQIAPAIVYERTVDASGDWLVEITSPCTGAEYSIDGDGTYSETNNPITFTAGTSSATIYARLSETTTHATSPASSITINFDKEDPVPPPAFELTYSVDTPDTNYSVAIPVTEGAEYSFDGSLWDNTVNEKSACLPGTTVTGYMRYKETTEANASIIVSDSITLPLFRVQTPTATPKGGNFRTTQNVALACGTDGAIIYYTLDGSTPTTGSIPYSASITLTKTTTVRAIAFKSDMADSAMFSAKYTRGSSSSSSSNISEESASYIVTFNLDGGIRTGGGALSQVVRWSASAEEPIVQRAGYTFDGWDQFLSGIITNTTITARWVSDSADADETETYVDDASDTAANPANNLDNWDNPFADVNSNDWYYADVAYVLANGLMNGTAPELFDPETNLTRGMLVTILYRLEGEPAISDLANVFDDVAAGQYYANAVQWAAANGLVTGYGDGQFGANDNITRQDLAVILLRYLNYKEINLAVTAQWIMFADESDIAGYAMDALQTLNKLGIINGIGTNEFGQIIVNPQANATRAQVAAMLHRFLELIK